MFALDKAPLVTPRPAASAPRPLQKQAKLDAFTTSEASHSGRKSKLKRRSTLGGPERERGNVLDRDSPPDASTSTRKHAAFEVYPDRSTPEGAEPRRRVKVEQSLEPDQPDARFRDIFRRAAKPGNAARSSSPSSAARSGTAPTSGIGRAILAKPTRRGPSIKFDRDLANDLSPSQEMLGEADRKKRRRIESSAASWGKLEMCDVDDHDGFGSPDKRRRSANRGSSVAGTARGTQRVPVLELEGDVKPPVGRANSSARRAIAPSQARYPVPPSPRAPSPRKRSRITPPASPVCLCPPTPSPTSSGSSNESTSRTAAALQAHLVPSRVPAWNGGQPAISNAEPILLVPESDPPEPPLEDGEEEPEPSTVDSSAERQASTPVASTPRPLKELSLSRVSDAAAPVTVAGPQRARRGDDSGFSEGGAVLASDDATPKAPLKRNLSKIDLTTLPTSSPTVTGGRRPMREDDMLDVVEIKRDGHAGGELGRTASGVLMPPPPLPVSPKKRPGRLRRGAPSTRAAATAEAEAVKAESLAQRSSSKDTSPTETLLDETQPSKGEGTAQIGLNDSYPWLFADMPRPNAAKGYTPIRFGALDHLRLPTPHPKDSPRVGPAAAAQSSPIRAPAEAVEDLLEPETVLPASAPHEKALSLLNKSVSGWTDAVAPAWAGARPPSPNAPRQAHLDDFFSRIRNTQHDDDGGRPESLVVEDSQAPDVDLADLALQRAMLQTRARMEQFRASMPNGREALGSAGDGQLAAVERVADNARSSSEPHVTPTKSNERRASARTPQSTQSVEDSDPEDDALAIPSACNRTRGGSTSPTKDARRGRDGKGSSSPLGAPVRNRFPRYSPSKLKRAMDRYGSPPDGDRSPRLVDAARRGAAAVPLPVGGETQWESYWSYPSQPGSAAGGHDEAPEPSPTCLQTILDKLEATAPALPEGWTRNEAGELVRLDADKWDPERASLEESLR